MNRNKLLVGVGILVLVLGAYFVIQSGSTSSARQPEQTGVWTCSMHPQIKMPTPGQCPICGMDLIPLESDQVSGEASLILSDRARKLASVRTSLVRRGEARLDIRLYGMLDFDESRLAHITARTRGRIERLFLDYTGIAVRKGDHMVELYSPELVTAQQELIQASIAMKRQREGASEFLQRTMQDNLESAREKLSLWGLADEQIVEIENSGEPEEVLTINAPVGGVVIHKDAVEGRYVSEGTKIYTIADLSELWLVLEAYESDLTWLRHGQEVEFSAEAIPGRTFKGMISFVDPVLDSKKRSVRVRANVDNSDGSLKPGMYVRAKVRPVVGAQGSVVSRALEGKWVGPMHPQVVSDEPGACPICGMELVTAESLGYVSSETEEGSLPLLIPATAPLITGRRAIVYVEVEPGSYQARTVVLGPRAGDEYLIYHGLKEGERVVVHGNFKIDSASQILAKPSMMMPDGGGKVMQGHQH